ncbi:Gfo/Idh/MocA family oxidoreductase [Aporhodopirellula aestuarii]|uniref:Gfo/Idh/MocA family oxidoreductase n=1 Tax=Aporhodopirellula aestuarii TaxID=2950107 RepID=A0ABT0U3P8_9BACT|nr:Gfo/Idh/MocA family oxidoreductase [Aporhodopirellula aestuarii]MCM2371289.1 Gfo/Idh/MocA family oxidoreductase [Aporhodopirellula aestuarii]
MPRIDRRHLLGLAAAGIGSAALPRFARAAGANEEVRMAVLGAGGRGGEIARAIHGTPGAKVVMVADPDKGRAEMLAGKYNAQAVTDLRTALDSDDIDAVAITTCNHWHCLASIWAIEAGKDVYVEKPLSHSQWEGRQVVLAAEKSGRIVQLGTQQRSDPIQMEARQYLHEAKELGEIKYVQANRLGIRGSIGKRDTPLTPPAGVDYDLWLGPAADEPIMRNNFHYDWHWDWNTGSGEMGNWGVHILDDIRNVAYQDQVSTPSRLICGGGRIGWNDAGETPNVHFALFETETFPTLIALSNLPSKPGEKSPWSVQGKMKVAAPNSGYAIVCEGGTYLGQRGIGRVVDQDGKQVRTFKAKVSTIPAHVNNFVEAVRSRDASSLAAPIENGHHSTGWCNLANVGFRAGGSFDAEQLSAASDLPQWHAVMDDMTAPLSLFGADANDLVSCPMLEHDPRTERFVGEHADLANPYLRREYRSGYEVKPVA